MGTKTWTIGFVLPLTAAAVVAAAPAASAASGARPGVQNSGGCSAASTWKLKAKHDNARIDVDFEVDSNKAGQTWMVHLMDNGVHIFTGKRVTQAPSGSFAVHKLTANRAGVDHIVAMAKNTVTGETCRGAVHL